MKYFYIILTALTISNFCFSQDTATVVVLFDTTGLSNSWKLIVDNNGNDSAFLSTKLHNSRINQEGNKVLSVWIKQTHLNEGYYNDVTVVSEIDFNCQSNRMKLVAASIYKNDGKFIKGSGVDNPHWVPIKYNTVLDKLSKAACKMFNGNASSLQGSNDIITSYNNQNPRQWEYAATGKDNTKWYVKKEYVSKGYEGIKVWIKIEMSSITVGKKTYRLPIQKQLITVDCKTLKTRVEQLTTYSANNTVIENLDNLYQPFVDVIPGSIMERVSQKVCELYND